MQKFALEAKTKRVVTDTVSLHVEAKNYADAVAIAERALSRFPDPHYEEGINYCFVEHRDNGPAEVLEINQEEDRGAA